MKLELVLVVCVLCVYSGVEGRPRMASRTNPSMKQIEDYFLKYHYMGDGVPDPQIAELYETNKHRAFQEATKMFQRRTQLPETGELNYETMKLIAQPRCGMPDVMTMDDMMMGRQLSRYAVHSDKWPKTDLTYTISQYLPARLNPPSKRYIDEEIRKAFKVWADVTPLTFTIYNPAQHDELDIEIKFVPSIVDHGDGSPFDGENGVLAHAFFPGQGRISGDAHFDDAETWTISANRGIDILQVAAHEFGHSLGLGHSTDMNALMAPFYQYKQNFDLPQDDINGIQFLYGKPTCRAPKFDAVASIKHRDNSIKHYVFSGPNYYIMNSDGRIDPNQALKIKDNWPSLPAKIEAALFWPDYTFVFEGGHYYQINQDSVLRGPLVCDKLPQNKEAAFYMSGKLYFIKDNKIYKYLNRVERGYPKDISSFAALPRNGIDAAYRDTTGTIFFFKDDKYYEYTTRNGLSAAKSIVDRFIECPEEDEDDYYNY